jgi:hypothetical protein
MIRGTEGRTEYNSCTLDRLLCYLGHTKGNVVPCCHTCNSAKGTLQWEFMITQPLMRELGLRIREVLNAERVRYEKQKKEDEE